MPQQVRGVVVDPAAPGKLSIKPVELRDPDRDEVAVRVTAISLNRGETRRAGMKSKRSTLGSAAFDFRRPPGPAGSSDGVPRLYTAVLLVGNVVISTVT